MSAPLQRVPVDAVCVGCRQVSIRHVEVERLEDVPTSFQHACGACGEPTWWNTHAVLRGLMRLRGDDQ